MIIYYLKYQETFQKQEEYRSCYLEIFTDGIFTFFHFGAYCGYQ